MNLFKLLYITNDVNVAKIADDSHVDEIFIDLEKIGKYERQSHLDTVISNHKLSDITLMKKNLKNSEVIVRCNPIGKWSNDEIDKIIDSGADTIMLPFFKKKQEVEIFLNIINARVKTCLLVETLGAVNSLAEILKLKDIERVHIGLNDIHIERKSKFMFEPFSDGMLEKISKLVCSHDIKLGIGGVSKIGSKLVPSPERILAEHVRLGSSSVILSRSFLDTSASKNLDFIKKEFSEGVRSIREYEKKLLSWTGDMFIKNLLSIKEEINFIINDNE